MTERADDKSPRTFTAERAMIQRVRDARTDLTLGAGDKIHVCQLAERFLDRLELDDATPPPSSAPSVDIERVKAWFYSKPRKQAQAAFTAGDERQIAYMLEDAEAKVLLANQAKAVVAMNAAAQSATVATDSEVLAKLQDTTNVCVNIIRGVIAKPSLRSLLHIYGEKALRIWDDANGDEKMAATDDRAARTEVEHAGGWIPVEWRRNTDPYVSDDTHIRQMRSPFYEGVKFCVRRHGNVLNKTGEWELEPMPSSRDDAFYERCRFDSFEAAVAVLDGPSNTPEGNRG